LFEQGFEHAIDTGGRRGSDYQMKIGAASCAGGHEEIDNIVHRGVGVWGCGLGVEGGENSSG
jgi:hypothetical protein